MKRTVAIAGSTGSVGRQAIEILAGLPQEWEVLSLSASSSVKELADQAKLLGVKHVGLAQASQVEALRSLLPGGVEVVVGSAAIASMAAEADVVLNAVVGFAGLGVTLEALRRGRRLALANKESLVAGGPVVQAALKRAGEILPVDSEHCALHQVLRSGDDIEVARLILTGSGGPFRGMDSHQLAHVTKEQALVHPTWSMGPKITVDSSTLMNKGLEVIEAHELFGTPYDDIEVVIHPQSIVHSMVEFTDGSTLAQLSLPDMRLPIGYALGFPHRLKIPYGRIDWRQLSRLDFEQPDLDSFGCLKSAYAAGREGKSAPAWLNAANEVAVAAFLEGGLRWQDIAGVVQETLDGWDGGSITSFDEVLDADSRARRIAIGAVQQRRTAA